MGDRRHRNRYRLLEIVERQGPISRAELARITRLSLPSVSEIVDELVTLGLAVWVGEGDSTGGRPPRLLEFNARRGAILAVDLSGSSFTLGAFLLDGTMLAVDVIEHREDEEVLATLVDTSRKMMATLRAEGLETLAMGVAAPGVTDPERGDVSFAPAVGWWETPVRKRLEEDLGIPVVVDNDVNAASLAERLFGEGASARTFAVVLIGTGVGMGIVIDGRVHRGHRFQAGEIGYMWVDGDRRTASGKGNLESYLAIPSILDDYRRLIEDAPLGARGDGDVMAQLLADFRAEEPRALRFIDERVDALAKALVNVYLVLAPEVIYLAGPATSLFHEVLPLLTERVKALSPLHPELRVSALDERAGLIGASTLASDRAKTELTGMRLGSEVGA